MMAVVPVVTGANKIMVGTNAGASPLAGKDCNRLYFSTSWNNDQTPEAMGKFLTDQGVNDLYVMAPNYQAGKDMVAGLKRYYKGRIVEEVYTKLGQQDYQAGDQPAAREEPEGGVRVLPGRHGHPVHQAVRPGRPARATPALHRVHGRRDLDPGGEGRGGRHLRDALLEPGPEEPGERRSSSPTTRRSTASCRCSTARRATTASC